METDIVVESSKADPGMWYWAFLVDGSVHTDGEAESAKEATARARQVREEWEYRNA